MAQKKFVSYVIKNLAPQEICELVLLLRMNSKLLLEHSHTHIFVQHLLKSVISLYSVYFKLVKCFGQFLYMQATPIHKQSTNRIVNSTK